MELNESEVATELRHGFLNDPYYLDNLQSHYYSHFDLKRNATSANPSPEDDTYKISDWKSSGNKKKTTMAALVMCLNLGIPPPDIMRPQEYPYMEAFINPSAYPDSKLALQAIGKSLQTNYESISSRAKYKQSLDPSVEDLKRLCTSLRRNAKDERILFHYNGHGVPQPTHSGEIWVFNRGYTQYIPVSLYDLQNWLGAPYIMVVDTNAAGHVIENNKKFIQKRIDDEANNHTDMAAPSPISAYIESIQLGACQSNEILPLNPDLPADLFTCCLTSPIEISIKWFIMFSPLRKKGYYDILKNKNGVIEIPGRLTDRRTPLGELNWIFIAVTDTIAWTALSRPLFKRLFRQDLVIAALFRNFLLAKKLMPEVGCHPISDPPLPDVSNHPMWDSWELAIDQILGQLLKKKESEPEEVDLTDIPQLQITETENDTAKKVDTNPSSSLSSGQNTWNYQHCSFFQQHLTAFEVWLQYGSAIKEPPQQLPIVLQVLLSQAHRLRALHLLSNFLDLGPWAVYLALSVGMFPYIQKLLQSPSLDLKPILIFIWTRIMSVDYQNVQQELIKDRGYNYFIQMLTFQPRPSQPHMQGNPLVIESPAVNNNVTFADQKAMSAFVLAMFVRNHKQAQKLAFSIEIVRICITYIESSESPLLRQWSALFISGMVKDHLEAIVIIMRSGATEKLLQVINDPIPEIRASIVDVLSNFIFIDEEGSDLDNGYGIKQELNQQDLKIANEILKLCNDGSALIRREVVCFFSKFFVKYFQFFLVCAFGQLEEEIILLDNPSIIDEIRRKSPAYGSVFSTIWKALLITSEDPHDEVKNYAQQIIDYIMLKLNESQLGDIVTSMEDYLLQKRTAGESRSDSTDSSLLVKLNDNNKYKNMPQVSSSSTRNRLAEIKKVPRRVQSLNVGSKVKHELEDKSRSSGSATSSTYGFSMHDKLSTVKSWLHLFGLYEHDGDETLSAHGLSGLLAQQPTTVAYGTNTRPTTPRFKPRDNNNGYPVLPFNSGFLDYSCEYFQESQLGPKEADEPGSEEYMRRIWRKNRNEAIIATTQPQKSLALTGSWKNVVSRFSNTTQPKILRFTQFEKWIAATDERDNITTFDWSKGTELSKLSNGNPFGTKITDLKFLNEDHIPLLMTGSSDGVVKIYKNFHDAKKSQLLTAWRALTDIILTPRSVGLVSEWQQSRGTLLVTGDVKVIKLWDAPREKCVMDIPVRSTSQILTMTSDQVSGNIVIAGFQDGSMRVYDRRQDPKDSLVKVYSPMGVQDKSPIRNVHMQRGGMRELISGNSNGLVQLWDIRQDDPIIKFKAFEKTMTAAFIHEHAPVIACANKEVDIYSTMGKLVSKITNTGFINTLNGSVRSGAFVNSIALHPHRMMLATNYNQNAEIMVHECREKNDASDDFYSREELIGDYS
jgi:regulator-associated protein of mTOR